MNCIVIGGTGFLGKNLISFLKENQGSMNIITISRSDFYMQGTTHINITNVGWKNIFSQLPQHDENIIIDFAYSSVPKTSFDDPVKDFTENLQNTIDHLEFAVKIKCTRYVYVSSGGTVYGEVGRNPIKEETSNFPIAPYGITKMASERYVNMYHKVYELNVCIVRPSNVYGPEQRPFLGQGFISTALALAFTDKPIKIYGDGSVVRDYLYIQDFCEGMLDVIQYGTNGEIYNIGSNFGSSINEVVDAINEVLKKENKALQTDYLKGRSFDVKYNVLDCAKLNKLNNWTAKTSLSEGIHQTTPWIKHYINSH